VGISALQQPLDCVDKSLNVLFQRRSHCVEPVDRPNEVGHIAAWLDRLDAQREDRHLLADCSTDLAHHLGRSIGLGGKEQDEHAAVVDRIHDCAGPLISRPNIARRDPTTDAPSLKSGTDSVGGSLV
jgi:hypothetical protein